MIYDIYISVDATDISNLWRVPKMGATQNGWLIMENPILNWMITAGNVSPCVT
jgi:hypothetical protein